MIERFIIGSLPGQNPVADFIQDSIFGQREMIYWIVNDQPNMDFTQDSGTRRVTWNQTFNSGDIVIVHLR